MNEQRYKTVEREVECEGRTTEISREKTHEKHRQVYKRARNRLEGDEEKREKKNDSI